MKTTTLEPIVRSHPFFAGLPDPDVALISGCAKNVYFRPGTTLAREGEAANRFYVLREGRVSLEIPAPQGGSVKVETLDGGEILGWSWLMPPYLWQFDAVALTGVRALEMDGACLRGKCDADPRLGYELMKRFSVLMAGRLAATRLQLLDLYGLKQPALSPP